MHKTSFLGIIPARYGSTRFPGKPLVKMGDKTMIHRVYDQVSNILDKTIVATDDKRIFDEVISFGGNVVMTSELHKSGTDRCHEAMLINGEKHDVIINIQGDEPFIKPEQIELLKSCFEKTDTQIATLIKPFSPDEKWETLANPNSPKVITNSKSEAIYFSRSVIPYIRGEEQANWAKHFTFYKHIGLYAYRADVLSKITGLKQSPLELAESLEQNRWIENGYSIRVAITNQETIGIDSPEDLEMAKKFF